MKKGIFLLEINTQTKIAEALLDLALENPTKSDFSMCEIAKRAGISRQAIYQKHYRNCADIVKYLRNQTNDQIFAAFSQYDPSSGQNAFDYFAYSVIPTFYTDRRLIRCFFTTAIDPAWRSFILKTYTKWGLANYETHGYKYHFSDEAMVQLLIQSTMAIVETWLSQENPTPPDQFSDDFLKIVKTPVYNLLSVKKA